MKTFKGGDKVPGGFYFNRAEWTMRVAPQEGGWVAQTVVDV